MQEFQRSLPMMLYRAIDNLLPRFRQIFSEYGLTETQWRVLRVLWDEKKITLKHLSAASLIPAPSLVGVVDRLADQGLVERVRNHVDRRQVFIIATAKGRALEEVVSPAVEDTYEMLEASLSPTAWRSLMNGLEQLSEIPLNPPLDSQNNTPGAKS